MSHMLNTSNRKTFIILIVLFFAVPLCAKEVFDVDVLEDFSTYKKGKLPEDGWRGRNGDPATVYSVTEESGNQFLEAHDLGNSIQLFRAEGWDINEHHIFSWQWRVHTFPKGSDELNGLNDSAAGVYVVFPKRWFVPESIKYIWSAKLPVGTIIRRKDHFPLMVIQSGTQDQGKWVLEKRDIYKDYEKLFGRSPPDPVAFGVLTDSNDTKSEALADYDDFKSSKAGFDLDSLPPMTN